MKYAFLLLEIIILIFMKVLIVMITVVPQLACSLLLLDLVGLQFWPFYSSWVS